ncbi:aminotransferase class V-fold PLP-dependent enzyme [Luteipulveratus flavus]|uniref:Aminotransferase class V-fold PLP-dependent enzyme n=1 Tax=Luteipulveratus flavus TaxID=3031728 RepID=A0ABT6C8W1_9MICO|nr:aminotransferase class V-fold PLP-dependent enzyme [Luteipulveratus sp. YIM 133296]MDF8265313.1 aminotransferase class V-fold PLP-dependent enzyme [Luteipulveratus sp. YIM 133296]
MSTAPLTSPSLSEQPGRRLSLVRRPAPAPRRAVGALPLTVGAELGVPTVHRTVVDFGNLDHAATTPALTAVAEAVSTVQRRYGSVHRGAGYTSRLTTDWFEQARTEVGAFVGARPDDEVVFTRNTTDSLRLLAHALPQDAEVIVFESAHHAALLPWPAEATLRLPVPTSALDAQSLLERALREGPAGKPRLVVVTGACNVTGDIWPVAELAAIARRHGARTVLDAAQLAPHRPVDIDALGIDWVALSGHKMYAPYGAGALVGRSDWLEAAAPYLPAGGATHTVSHRHTRWQQGPARHEGGTPNAVGAIALASACASLSAHRDAVEAHEAELLAALREGLAAVPGVRVHHVLGPAADGVGVATFTVEGYEPSLVSQVLADEYGLAVRDGRFCAHLLCETLFDGDGTAVRASIGLATTREHVERLVRGVRGLVEHGPSSAYEYTVDGWVAQDDPRDLSEPRPW